MATERREAQSGTTPEGHDEAMNRVLEAERTARAAIDACREEAERAVEEARLRARRIAERTDTRIAALHGRCAEAGQRQVQALLAEAAQARERTVPAAHEEEIMEAAIARLAAWLTDPGAEL